MKDRGLLQCSAVREALEEAAGTGDVAHRTVFAVLGSELALGDSAAEHERRYESSGGGELFDEAHVGVGGL